MYAVPPNKPQIDWKSWILVLTILVVFVLMGVCMSCKYTPQKAVQDATRANQRQPATVAKLVRDWYPCTTTKADTTVLLRDTTVYIPCPDSVIVLTRDGVSDTVVQYVKVPVKVAQRMVTVVQKIEDSAKIKLMASHINELDNTLNSYEKNIKEINVEYVKKVNECDGWQARAHTRFWWLIALIAVLGTVVVFKIKSLFKL